MQARGVRDRVVLVTKGGLAMGDGLEGLGRDYLPRACEASLRRLRTDYIDVYMAHRADAAVPVGETLEAFAGLIEAGRIRYAGCSNYTPDELEAAMAAAGGGRARYEVVEPHYNLVDRDKYEGDLEGVCTRHGLGVIPYFALAAGFLTGKYRTPQDLEGRPRSRVVSAHLNPRGLAVLDALDAVAGQHGATPAQVALAWLMARPSVAAPIASATSVAQLRDILGAADLELAPEDLSLLEA
jgi:aryl-alcohol dehydrogenase-like predicted oxidoreductase